MGIPLVALQGQGPEIAKGLGDVVTNQMSLQKMMTEQQQRKQDLQINDLKIQSAQKQLASQSASQRALKDSGGDPEKYFKLSSTYGVDPTDIDKQMKALDDYKKAGLAATDEQNKQTNAQTKAVGDALASIRALPEEARAAALPTAVQHLVDTKMMDPQTAQPLMQYQGPEWLDKIGTAYNFHDQVQKQINEERATVKAAQETEEFNAKKSAGTLAGPLRAKTAELQLYDQAKAEGSFTGTIDDWLKERAKEKTSTSTAGLTLSPEAVDMAAQNFVITGTMPALGMGSPAIRQQILNRAGEIANNKGAAPSGAGATVAANKAGFASDSAALTQLNKNRAAVGAFENTALPNLKLFEDQAAKVVDTGSPWINAPLRSIARSGLGSADQAAYDAARQVATTEIARVVAQPNLVGQLSDEARSEMQSALGPNATLKQILAASKILRQDMANRKSGLDQEIAATQQRIRGGASGAAAPTKRKSLDEIFQ